MAGQEIHIPELPQTLSLPVTRAELADDDCWACTLPSTRIVFHIPTGRTMHTCEWHWVVWKRQEASDRFVVVDEELRGFDEL